MIDGEKFNVEYSLWLLWTNSDTNEIGQPYGIMCDAKGKNVGKSKKLVNCKEEM